MNYDSVNEIFAAGVTNMTCLLQNSNNYDGGTLAVNGADFLLFKDSKVSSIFAHGDSYWGIGTDTSNLKSITGTPECVPCTVKKEHYTAITDS